MKVLVVGGGAREHAMAYAAARSPDCVVFGLMKNANPGIQMLAKKTMLASETDAQAVVAFAREIGADVVAVGPEAPLAAGVADALQEHGVPVASPTKAAAAIETDKAFMRRLLKTHVIPGNVGFEVFTEREKAQDYLSANGPKFALKPVGLTGGKGVQVYGDHFEDLEGALDYANHVFENNVGGGHLIVEELLDGEEFTVQAFTDGRRVVPMVAVQDHKRLLPDDQGPNTGGMGSYSQGDGLLPFLTRKDWEEALDILSRIVSALNDEGRTYKGPIYGQFMLTHQGPRVIEVNARFGDPEAMNVLHLLESNFSEILARMAEGNLTNASARFREAATVVKYVVPEGYGTQPVAGAPIEVDEAAIEAAHGHVYYASVDAVSRGKVTTTSSRALAILGEGETLHEANEVCEEGLKHVRGRNVLVRHDIGTRELIEKRLSHMRILRES